MQSRLLSLVEALVGVVIGFSINWTANMLILPLFGFNVSGGQAFGIGLFFTVISVARSFAIRRLFNYGLRAAIQRVAKWLAHLSFNH
jgi:type IV secretory pathway protease TraF